MPESCICVYRKVYLVSHRQSYACDLYLNLKTGETPLFLAGHTEFLGGPRPPVPPPWRRHCMGILHIKLPVKFVVVRRSVLFCPQTFFQQDELSLLYNPIVANDEFVKFIGGPKKHIWQNLYLIYLISILGPFIRES